MKNLFNLKLYLAVLAVSCILTLNSAAQTPPPPVATPTPRVTEDTEIIRVDTELVNLNVRVVDRLSRPIANLKPADFQIYEDNVLQQIEFFSQSEVPTNYSMVIDNSGSLRSQIEQVIEASKILINSNRPGDETSIIRFVGRDKIEILQDFTPDKDDLEYAVENLHIDGGQTALIDAVYLAAERVNEYQQTVGDPDNKRRALILVSDGEDRQSFYNEKQLFQLLAETNVQIYVVGFVKDLDDKSGFIRKSEQSKAKSFLQKLATETGGRAYFPDSVNQLNDIAREISTELRTQYSIGYLPTNDREDGTFRNIRVTVKDGPDSQKRIAITRTGRTAGRPDGSPTLQKATQVGKDQ
jgi:Ca-activated chloride channel family protein